jgi:hypothetical protein
MTNPCSSGCGEGFLMGSVVHVAACAGNALLRAGRTVNGPACTNLARQHTWQQLPRLRGEQGGGEDTLLAFEQLETRHAPLPSKPHPQQQLSALCNRQYGQGVWC